MLLCCTFLASCSFSDGAFRQTDGRPIDYETVDSLVEGGSFFDEVVARLGHPASRQQLPDGSVEIVYRSTRKRESVERVLGAVRNRHSQTIEERVVLVFKDGRLVRKQQHHEIY